MTEAVTLTCADCPTPISGKGRTGRCKPCASRFRLRDPIFAARRLAAQRAAMATPEHRAKMSAARRRVEDERRDDPAWRAYKRSSGKRLRAQYEASPAALAANLAKRPLAGRKTSLKRLGWLLPEYRQRYENLRDRVGAAEAKRRILAMMTPFERQLAAVRGGARLIAKPVVARAEHAFTLGGVAPEAM